MNVNENSYRELDGEEEAVHVTVSKRAVKGAGILVLLLVVGCVFFASAGTEPQYSSAGLESTVRKSALVNGRIDGGSTPFDSKLIPESDRLLPISKAKLKRANRGVVLSPLALAAERLLVRFFLEFDDGVNAGYKFDKAIAFVQKHGPRRVCFEGEEPRAVAAAAQGIPLPICQDITDAAALFAGVPPGASGYRHPISVGRVVEEGKDYVVMDQILMHYAKFKEGYPFASRGWYLHHMAKVRTRTEVQADGTLVIVETTQDWDQPN